MIVSRIRRQGHSYVVTIPRKEMERLELREGQIVGLDIQPMELRPVLRPELREHYEASFRQNEAGLRYLADR